MGANNCRLGAMVIVISMLFVSMVYGQNTKIETSTAANSLKEQTLPGDSSQKDSDVKPRESDGLFPIGKIHAVIREERAAALREIDIERKATLVYLTQERQVVVDELKTELNRITDLLQSERRATMMEMEAVGNRIAENTILKSEKLIDHFFIRAFQFALIVILSVSILGIIIFRMVVKSR